MPPHSRSIRLVLAAAGLLVAGAAFLSYIRPHSDPFLGYHLSAWNEYMPDVDRGLAAASSTRKVGLAHVYGGIVSHHIPTTIPKLVQFYLQLKAAEPVRNFIILGPDHVG